jgi:hypothetical protein
MCIKSFIYFILDAFREDRWQSNSGLLQDARHWAGVHRANRAGEPNEEGGACLGGALDDYRTHVVVDDLADDGQAHAGSVGFTQTYERIK